MEGMSKMKKTVSFSWQILVGILFVCGCGSKEMSRNEFVHRFLADSVSTNLQVAFYTKAGPGGQAAIARVTGNSNEIRSSLFMQGFNVDLPSSNSEPFESLRLRMLSISTEAASNLLPQNAGNSFAFFSDQRPTEVREVYTQTNCSEYYLIVIRR